jgi:hypothetical protein
LRSQERISYNHQFEAPVNVGQGGPQVWRLVREKRSGIREDVLVSLTCPTCGNQKKFLVKTLQMHVVQLDDSRVEVSEETRPVVLEVLCDECESALKFEEFEDTLRKEVLLTLGAR